jgi:hypothetical protein
MPRALYVTKRRVRLLLLTVAAFTTSTASFIASSGTLTSSRSLSFLVPTSIGSSSCRLLGSTRPMPVPRITLHEELGQVPSILLSASSSATSSSPVGTVDDDAPKEDPELEQEQQKLVLIGTCRKATPDMTTIIISMICSEYGTIPYSAV